MKKIITIIALVASAGAHAEFKDGNKLLSELNSEVYYSKGVAMGYIMGVSDFGWGITHCTPGNVTLGQMFDMVKAHLIDHPEYRHLAANVLVNNVLSRAWPCKKGQSL